MAEHIRAIELRAGDTLLDGDGAVWRVLSGPARITGTGDPGLVAVKVALHRLDPGYHRHLFGDQLIEVERRA